jgi:AsmA protein
MSMAKRGSSGRGWIGWVIGIIVAIVVLLVVAVFVGPMLIPADAIRARIVSAVHDATGRDLDIKGGLSVSILPTLGVAAKDVSFSNAPWAGGKPMISLSRLDVRLEVIPLISGTIKVSSFVLEKPDIDLETDKNGRGNWEFQSANAGSAAPLANPGAKSGANQSAAPAPSGGGGSPISGIALGDVRITDGHVTYRDGVTGKSEVADAINLKVSLPDMESALKVDGSVHWRDKTVNISLGAAKPSELMYGAGSPFDIKLDSDPIKLAFSGSMGLAGQPKGAGDLDLTVPSVRNLVAWATGQPLTMPGDGLGPLSIKGKVTVDGPKYALASVLLGLDTMKATGDIAVDTGGAKPSLKGKLAVDKLDLNHYMGGDKNSPAAQPAAAKTTAAQGTAGKPATTQQAGAGNGWSDDPIDASGLKAANVALGIAADSIVYQKVTTGKTSVQVTLTDGRLILDLTDMVLYQGEVKGRVQVDGTAPQLATDANLHVEKVQVGPLMLALADSDRVTGAVVSDSQVTSRGKSQRELIGALNGKGNFALQNGVIKGVDVVGMVKDVASKAVGGKGGETSFSSATGTYVITNGVLKNGDLVVNAPTLTVNGAGTVDMPKRTIDYKVKAALAGTLTVPINVTGPWNAIDYSPDLQALLTENVGNAGKLVGSGVKGVGGVAGSVGDKVKGGLGKLFGQ